MSDSSDKDPFSGLDRAMDAVDKVRTVAARGRITQLIGLVMRAAVPGVRVGDLVSVERRGFDPLRAEVVGFRAEQVVLMPFGDVEGVGPDSAVTPLGRSHEILCGPGLMGRVLSGLGEPVDGDSPLDGQLERWAVNRPSPDALQRQRVARSLSMGVRVLDGLLTVGEGQRVGLFSGSGVGKSTLLGQIARNTEAELNVICLVGERGREVREFIEETLGPEGLKRSVVVCATSDAPSLVRISAAHVATAVAEYFRDQGSRVLFMMDSVTRYARALREVGLAAGEPPARRGFPPSVFAALPRLLERTGNSGKGSITAIYTVLVEGGDMDEPIADEVRSILDGHVVLSRELASRNHYPAVDVLKSLSRVMSAVADPDHQRAAAEFRKLLAAYEAKRDLVLLGAYKKGGDPELDRALDRLDAMRSFLCQGTHQRSRLDDVKAGLLEIVS